MKIRISPRLWTALMIVITVACLVLLGFLIAELVKG